MQIVRGCCQKDNLIKKRGQEDKGAAFGKFLAHIVRRKLTALVTSSNGVLTVPVRQTLPESQAKESMHALNEPGTNNSTISITTGPFTGYHFFKN